MRAILIAAIAASIAAPAFSASWRGAKNTTDDSVYKNSGNTFYCGCEWRSHQDSDGSGDIVNTGACGYDAPSSYSARASRVEWEHVVPASLMPARDFPCWTEQGRKFCERHDPAAQAMIFDLHNLVPSIGQVNALRRDDRYTEGLPDDASDFGACEIEDVRGGFEPPDCKKGDAARIWLYMRGEHGVKIPADELEMFQRWSEADPVSPWESERDQRIAVIQGGGNPFVEGVVPDAEGACSWE